MCNLPCTRISSRSFIFLALSKFEIRFFGNNCPPLVKVRLVLKERVVCADLAACTLSYSTIIHDTLYQKYNAPTCIAACFPHFHTPPYFVITLFQKEVCADLHSCALCTLSYCKWRAHPSLNVSARKLLEHCISSAKNPKPCAANKSEYTL